MSELFAAIVRDWGKKFSDKKLRIDVAVDPNVPVIRADVTRLQEVLYNLLDNALKYSPPNGKIRLHATRRDNQVVLGVSDTGVGISEADLPRIFERFYRVHNTASQPYSGIGLGLYVAKAIIDGHGGQIWLANNPGTGSTFYFSLPT